MLHILLSLTVAVASVLLILPWLRKPLTEDEGNWFYLAALQDKGVRLYEDCHAHGYFNLSWFAALAARMTGRHDAVFFQCFKIAWNALTILSCYGLAAMLGYGPFAAAITALTYALVVATPRTMFILTYAEHFLIFPMNLTVIAVLAGSSSSGPEALFFFMLAGVFAGFVVQFKPTGLLFSGGSFLSLLLCDSPATAMGLFAAGFVALSILPVLPLKAYDFQNEYIRAYLASTFIAPVVNGISALMLLLGLSPSDRLADSIYADIYTTRHHADVMPKMERLRANLFPALRDLRLILVFAAIGLVWRLTEADPRVLVPLGLAAIALAAQQLQQNYYTPHFNPLWLSVSLLAGDGVAITAKTLSGLGVAGAALAVILLWEMFRLGRLIAKSFSPSETKRFGILHPVVGELFALAEPVGRFIRENSAPQDSVLVWGNHPSIYIYANRPSIDSRLLFVYGQDNIPARQEEALDTLQNNPPDLLLFYFWRAQTDWNIQRIMEATGTPFRQITSFALEDAQGTPLTAHHGGEYLFDLYRRDDEKFLPILRERAFLALLCNNEEFAERILNQIFTFDESDPDASLLIPPVSQREISPRALRKRLAAHAASKSEHIRAAAQRGIGLALLLQGNSKASVHSFERSLEQSPDSPLGLALLGEAYRRDKQAARALRTFEKALALNAFSPLSLAGMGFCLHHAGNTQAATAFLDRADAFAVTGARPPALEEVP